MPSGHAFCVALGEPVLHDETVPVRDTSADAVMVTVVALVGEDAFVRAIEGNTLRYLSLFSRAVDEMLLSSPLTEALNEQDGSAEIVRYHRLRQLQEIQRSNGEEPEAQEKLAEKFPAGILRTYEMRIAIDHPRLVFHGLVGG